jgi:hypothetical protein
MMAARESYNVEYVRFRPTRVRFTLLTVWCVKWRILGSVHLAMFSPAMLRIAVMTPEPSPRLSPLSVASPAPH